MSANPPSPNAPDSGAVPHNGGSAQESQRIWTEAFRAFDALYELPAAERGAALERLRAADLAVADAVRGLLAEHDAQVQPAGDGEGDPGATQRRPDVLREGLRTLPRGGSEPLPEAAPETIGPWRLLRELGRGGTARVWLARREDVPWLREVALKVPLMGVYRDDQRERLVRERDILSRLEHPNIARLYDAGFAEAQPWLAIEYVQGQDILSWCDTRTLGLRERVALFRQVLRAVQYAHAALIVHRDIKPENILVTADGSARLLDFGIAKLIAEGASHTETTQLTHLAGRMLTPAYASPEQLRDEPLTTGTDIYSLGVVLYQLLTGVHPAVGAGARSIQQVERAVTEGRLALASRSSLKPEAAQARGLAVKSLKRSLSGDLEAILAKALNLEPAQRYETAAAFDAELEAWLDGRPVRARKPGWLQLTAKLVRRHPVASALGVAAVLALTLTTVLAVVQAREARLQEAQARVEADRARASKDFLLGLFESADPDHNGGRDVLARDLLARGEQRIERDLVGQPSLQVDMLEAIARVWSNFGDMERAAQAMRRRTEVVERTGTRHERFTALLDEARQARENNDDALAERLVSDAQSMLDPQTILDSADESRLWLEQANVLINKRQYNQAIEKLDDMIGIIQMPSGAMLKVEALYHKAYAQRTLENFDESLTSIDAAWELLGRRAGASPAGAASRVDLRLSVQLERLRVLRQLGQLRAGWPMMQSLMKDAESWVGENSNRSSLFRFRHEWLDWQIRAGLIEPARQWVMANPREYLDIAALDASDAASREMLLARLWAGVGDMARAESHVARARLVAPELAPSDRIKVSIAEATMALLRGRPATALAALDAAQQAQAGRHLLREARLQLRTLRAVALASAAGSSAPWQGLQTHVDSVQAELGERHPVFLQAVLLMARHCQVNLGAVVPECRRVGEMLARAGRSVAEIYPTGSVWFTLFDEVSGESSLRMPGPDRTRPSVNNPAAFAAQPLLLM